MKSLTVLFKSLRQFGLGTTLRKVWNRLKIEVKRSRTLDTRSIATWKSLKGAYKGQRAFLIGNGPSLNQIPLYLLDGEYVMCFNRFNLMFERLPWRPSFYMCVDSLVAEDMSDEINKIVPEVEIAFFPDIHVDGTDFRKFIIDQSNIQWLFPSFKGFYFDLPKVGLGGTVAFPGLQVLTYLGFSEIFIIGVDMNYQVHENVNYLQADKNDIESKGNDDPNHFDPRYFGTNRKYHQPDQGVIDNIMASFDRAANAISTYSPTIVKNAGANSRVESFEKVPFVSLFQHYKEEQKFALFQKPYADVIRFDNFEQMMGKVQIIRNDDDLKQSADCFLCPLELGLSRIKELVFNYIPYGPYKNHLFFISRNKLNLSHL